MVGYVLGILTFTYEEDFRGEIYRCHNNSSYEIFWSEVDLNSRIYELKNEKNAIDGVDGMELTLITVESTRMERLEDIT